MRKLLIVTAIASIAFTSTAEAGFRFGSGWGYGCSWWCGGGGTRGVSAWGGAGIAAGVSGAVAIGTAIAGRILARPQPVYINQRPPQPVYAPNTVPGCYQQQVADQYGRVAVQTICP